MPLIFTPPPPPHRASPSLLLIRRTASWLALTSTLLFLASIAIWWLLIPASLDPGVALNLSTSYYYPSTSEWLREWS